MWCFPTLKGGVESSTATSRAKKGGNSGLLPVTQQMVGRGSGHTLLAERGIMAIVTTAATGVKQA